MKYQIDDFCARWLDMSGWERDDFTEEQYRSFEDSIRNWYRNLCQTEPCMRDVNHDIIPRVRNLRQQDNCLSLELPDTVGRLHHVRLPEWKHPVAHFWSTGSLMHARQASQLLRATPACPVAVRDGERLLLYGINTGNPDTEPARRISELYAVGPATDDILVFPPYINPFEQFRA